MFCTSTIIAVYLCYYYFMPSQTHLQFKSNTSLNARISNTIALLLMYKAHVGRCLQIGKEKRKNRGREKLSECISTDGVKKDPKGIQSVPWGQKGPQRNTIRAVTQPVCHLSRRRPGFDVGFIVDNSGTGTRFYSSTSVSVCRYHLSNGPYALACHQPHIIASDSVVKQNTQI